MSKKLTLEMADTICNLAIKVCTRNNFAPVTVNVVGPSAHVIVKKTMDNSPLVGIPEFSQAKAQTCITTKNSSRTFRDKYTGDANPSKFCQMTSMVNITDGKMAPFPGGILIKNDEGEILGAVGVSGASGDEDEYIALRGVIESGLGLVTIPEKHSCKTVQDKE